MIRVQSRFDSKEIGELVCDGALKYVQNFAVEIDGERVAEYKSLDEVSLDWKDYTPKEPLIKDEKVRKAVRLCADIWGAEKILVIKSGSRIEFSDGTPNMRYVSFMFAKWQDEIEDRTYYTIAELCGESEP